MLESEMASEISLIRSGDERMVRKDHRQTENPDCQGVRSRNLHVRVDEVYATDPKKDFIYAPPAWWGKLFREGPC